MSAMTATPSSPSRISGGKIAAFVIWCLGVYMTNKFFEQMGFGGEYRVFLALAIQVVLTMGQGPVWAGRGNILSYSLLFFDALINFGGCLAFSTGLDRAGSVQAFTGSFFSWNGDFPVLFEAIVALFIASLIAGLPEYLWKRG